MAHYQHLTQPPVQKLNCFCSGGCWRLFHIRFTLKMSCSAKIKLRRDYGRDASGNLLHCRQDGTCTVLVQVIINRKVMRFDLETTWYPDFFDEAAGLALFRHRDDTQAADVNMEAAKALGQANTIFLRYRADETEPTPSEFKKQFRNPLSRTDFVAYFAAKVLERYQTGEICKLTYDTQLSSQKALAGFQKKIAFSALASKNFAARFEAHLLALGKKSTTRASRHKDMNTYLNLARKDDHITFAHPYADFKIKKGTTNRRALPQCDVQLLDAHYQTLPVGAPLRPVLRRWLFSLASCGMRISDARRVERDWRFEDTLIFKPWKGRRRSDRHIKVLLGARAMQLWDEAIAEQDHPHYVFTDLSGQKSNDWLKAVAAELGISRNIFNHQARRTFGSLYLAQGGQLVHLQDYFGHANISATMIYVEPMPAQRREESKKVDAIFGTPPARLRETLLPRPLAPLSWHLRNLVE